MSYGKYNNEYDQFLTFELLGDNGSGKSSLLFRFVDNHFSEASICAIGNDFKTKTIETDYGLCKLQIWDTAYSERYCKTNKGNERYASAYIIVLDLTNPESFHNVQEWINYIREKHIRKNFVSPTIIIVGNKTDLIAERKVAREDAIQFCKLSTYFETSAKNGEGVEELFKATTDLVCSNFEGSAKQIKRIKDSKDRFVSYLNELKENCLKITDGHPEQVKLKKLMLAELKTIPVGSIKTLSSTLQKYSQTSQRINNSEKTGFFTTPKAELATVCDNLLEKIKSYNPVNEYQKQEKLILNSSRILETTLKTITEKFGSMGDLNGEQIPLGGTLFTGIFGKEPTQAEQELRINMILLGQKYTSPKTNLIEATSNLTALKQDLKFFNTCQSETITKGKKDVLAVANESNYPTWLILLFCIPVLGQIGWAIFELIKCCLPDPDVDVPVMQNNFI